MSHDDFEQELRRRLVSLAHQAVRDTPAEFVGVPRAEPSRTIGRGHATRTLASAVAVLLVVATVAGVVALRRSDHSNSPAAAPTRWTTLPSSPLSPRSGQVAVFTGHDVLVWGGTSQTAGGNQPAPATPASGATIPTHALADGALYDLRTTRWRMLPRAPIAARTDAIAVWTGKEMIVTGGTRDLAALGPGSGAAALDGAAYNPTTNSWRRISDTPTCPTTGTWTGRELIVGGRCPSANNPFLVAAYDPIRNTWTTLPTPPSEPTQIVTVADAVIAWDGSRSRGSVLDANGRSWSALPAMPDAATQTPTITVASPTSGLVVLSLEHGTTGPDRTSLDILDATRRVWRHSTADAEPPLINLSAPPEATIATNTLVWSTLDTSYGYDDLTVANAGMTGRSPIRLDRHRGSLLAIGSNRYFIWGGLLGPTKGDQTNRPTNDGVTLELGT